MPDGYLPPVVVDILGQDSDIIRKIAEVKTALADLSKDEADPTITADIAPLDAKIAEAEAELDALGAKTVSPTIAPHMSLASSLASAAALSGMTRGLLNNFADLAGIKGAAGMGTKGDVISALVGAGVATESGGKGGGGGGFLKGLLAGGVGGQALWGGGTGLIAALMSPLTMLSKVFSAGLGTVGSFAGFGPEHLAMTVAGLLGTATAGGIGGGLLGLGSLGVMGVGMGTDMAGIGQASGDIKTYNGLLTNLNQAIAVYGKGSIQAALAQYQMNQFLKDLSPSTQKAIASANATAVAFHAMFDQMTGPAETVGAHILQQLMVVGEAFLPTIGKFALENMDIIQKGMQPLMTWLDGPGLAIFQDLEQEFTDRLPTGIHMLTQGFELFIKTIDVASHYGGGFTKTLDNFFTKWNSPEFFTIWESHIGLLIGDFHAWEGLVKILGKDIVDLFEQDAGTPRAIVSWLTQMLTKLNEWETSVNGKESIHNLFEVHKNEIIGLLNLLPSLIKSFGSVYMTVAPALTSSLTTVLEGIAPILDALAKNPFGAWLLGLGLLAGKFGLLSSILGGLGKVAWATIGGGLKTIATEVGIINAEGDLGLAGIAKSVGILGAGVAAYFGTKTLLDYIFGKPNNVKPSTSLTPQTLKFIQDYNASLKTHGSIGQNPIAIPQPPATGWQLAWNRIKTFFGNIWHDINNTTTGIVTGMYHAVDGVWQGMDRDTRHWFGDVEAFLVGIWQGVDRDTRHWVGDVEAVVVGTWQRVDMDTRHWFGDVLLFVSNVWHTIAGVASAAALGLWRTLDGIWQHIDLDVRHWFGDVVNFFTGLPGSIIRSMGSLLVSMKNFGASMISQLIAGIGSMAGALGGAITHLIPGLSIGKGGVSVFGHHIPGTATGGIVTGPQVRLVGEAGPEAIIPLTQASRELAGIGGMGETHITVNANTNADAKQIAMEMGWEMRRMMAGMGH